MVRGLSGQMTAFDPDRVEHIIKLDIPAWLRGSGDWFTIKLLDLIQKADTTNRERLRDCFPSEVEAFEEWQRS